MQQKYTISVVLAAFRGEKFLAEQLDSLEKQTAVPDEILFCDDSPDDASCRIAAQYPRVRILKNASPLGPAANFARGIREAGGELVFLSDQDDVWLPGKIEKMISCLGDSGGVFCNSTLTDGKLHPLGCDHWSMRGLPAGELAAIRSGRLKPEAMAEIFCRRVLPAAHDMMFRTSLLEKLLPFPPLPACHDSFLGMAVALSGGWSVCNEELTLFRRHDRNFSGMGKKGALAEAVQSLRENTFAWNRDLYQAVFDRYGFPPAGERAEHSAVRAGMQDQPLFRRLCPVWKEWQNGHYRRFGRGWKNVVQDLVLRSFVS